MLVYKGDGCRVHRLACLRCNCYLVQTAAGSLLVDTSVKWERTTLLKGLAQLGTEGLLGILLTHTHTDHVGNAAFLQRHFGCPLYADITALTALRAGRCEVPVGTGFASQLVSRAVGATRGAWQRFEPCEGELRLADSLPLHEWLPGAYVLATPGHTEDSLSLILPAGPNPMRSGGAALVGDAMMHNTPGKLYPAFATDEEEVLASWDKLLHTGSATFLPGHGRPIALDLLRSESEKRSGARSAKPLA